MKEKFLQCLACDNRTVIQRKDSKNRPTGHIKHLWCFRCKARRPHIECDELEEAFSSNLAFLESGGGA